MRQPSANTSVNKPSRSSKSRRLPRRGMSLYAANLCRSSQFFLRDLEVPPTHCVLFVIPVFMYFRSLVRHWLQCHPHSCRLRADCRHQSAAVSLCFVPLLQATDNNILPRMLLNFQSPPILCFFRLTSILGFSAFIACSSTAPEYFRKR